MKCDKVEIKGKNKVHIQSCLQVWNVLPPTSIVKASYSSLTSVWSVFSPSDSTLTLIYTPDRICNVFDYRGLPQSLLRVYFLYSLYAFIFLNVKTLKFQNPSGPVGFEYELLDWHYLFYSVNAETET